MNLRQLRYFVAVAELGSFSEAARRLGVAQPALSRHVKELERELGASLLDRTVRGAEMTGQGEKLFHSAQGILRQVEQLPEVIGEQCGPVSGRVVIGLPTSVSAILANPILRAARDRYPNVKIHLIDLASGFLEEWLDTGRLDICVVYDPRRNVRLRIDDILVENLCLVGPLDALPAGRTELSFAELSGYPLALPSAPHSIRQIVERTAQAQAVELNVVLEVDSLAVSRSFVRDGLAFIVSTQGAVHDSIGNGMLGAVKIVDPEMTRRVSLTTSALRGSTRACDAIRKLILDVARQLLESGEWKGTSRQAA